MCEDIHKHHHPLDIVRVTSPALLKLKSTPTLGHSQAPPLGHFPCDVIHIPRGVCDRPLSAPVTHTLHWFSGSGQVQRGGGGGGGSLPSPPWTRHCIHFLSSMTYVYFKLIFIYRNVQFSSYMYAIAILFL